MLLKNNGTLPLNTNIKVALFGEHADNIYYMLGDYTAYQNETNCKTLRMVFEETFDNALYTKGWDFEGNKDDFDNAIDKAQGFDVAVVTLGGSSARAINKTVFDYNNGAAKSVTGFLDCGEARDIGDLKLPGNQLEFVRKLKEKGIKVVALVIGGRPYELTEL